ncbi:MAG: hypothetical protein PVH85_24740 [Desulfobacterales bacterium]|jgi:hypothetical protein
MNVMLDGIPPWSGESPIGNLNAKNKTTQAEQSDFKKLLGIEKVELSKQAKVFKEALALIKEVGFVEFTRITRAVNQIQRALTRVIQDFPAHKKAIEEMIDSYDNQMPRSVSDALSRLQGMLKDSRLPQEVIDAIMRYVEEEMKQSSDSQVYDSKMKLIDMKS